MTSPSRMVVNPFRVRGRWGPRGEWPPQFKAAGKRPVKGGRWSVRQTLDGRWKAWTTGLAKTWNTSFLTWEYAVKWAHLVAQYHEVVGPKNVSREYLRYTRKKFKALDEELYYSRPRRIDFKAYPNRRQNHP